MTSLKVRFAPAARVPDAALPVLPGWFPLPPRDDGTAPLTERERAVARRERAVREASSGPWDGRTGTILLRDGEKPLDEYRDLEHPGYVYEIDRSSSSPGIITYRYSPLKSPNHPATMRAVEDAFREAGVAGALDAREGTDKPEPGILTLDQEV